MKREAFSQDQVVDKLLSLVEEQGSQKKAAEMIGCSLPYFNDILNYRREPGKKILDALGLEKLVLYVPIASQK